MPKKGRLGSIYWSGLREASDDAWDELAEAEAELAAVVERDRARAARTDQRAVNRRNPGATTRPRRAGA